MQDWQCVKSTNVLMQSTKSIPSTYTYVDFSCKYKHKLLTYDLMFHRKKWKNQTVDLLIEPQAKDKSHNIAQCNLGHKLKLGYRQYLPQVHEVT